MTPRRQHDVTESKPMARLSSCASAVVMSDNVLFKFNAIDDIFVVVIIDIDTS